MLEDVNPLPGAEGKIAIIHGDGKAGISQHGADVGGGVVGSFQIMGVPTVPFGDEAFHEGFEVGAGGGVPVFADDQKGAGVLDKEKAHPFADVPFLQLPAER